jgi:hypothetical protein
VKPNTCLVIDVWEGNPDLDEAVLKAGGVAGIGIRLNDMNGGHHMDKNFVIQWEQSKNFVRFPYFVYNPWVDGQGNYNWLKANMPAEAKSVAVDVEVSKFGYAANTYAGELIKFLNLCKPLWKTIIYTGEWFLLNLTSWPKTDYWWAQYPTFDTFFNQVADWDILKTRIERLDKPFNYMNCPGTVKMWQFGDKFLLPGAPGHFLDCNLFYGSEEELAAYFGNVPETEPDPNPNPDPEPVVTFKKVSLGNTPINGIVTVTYTLNNVEHMAFVDQRVTNPPNTTPSKNFYRVAAENWKFTHAPLKIPPNGGPLTQTMSHTPKTAYEETLLPIQWQQYIQRFNDERGWKKISAKDYGPSKGINGNGLLRYIGLVYPSNANQNNIVNVLEISGSWARIESIPIDGTADLAKLSPHLTPWLFHMVCDNLGNPLPQNIVCPILGGPWWVPLLALVKK